MSDNQQSREATVRPARVWAGSELLSTTGKAGAFVAQSWASQPAAALFGRQQIGIEITLPVATPMAQAPSPEDSAPMAATATDEPPPVPQTIEAPVDQAALERAREEGFTRGFEEGRATLRTEVEAELVDLQRRDRDVVDELQRALNALKHQPETLFEPLKRLALHLAEQLVLAELTLEPKAIERLVQRCVDELGNQDEAPVVVTLNPADVALLQALRQRAGMGSSEWKLHPDSELMPGSVRASAQDAVVEDLIENRIEALACNLLLDEPRWNAQSAFKPERMAGLARTSNRVEDARPRMATPGGYRASGAADATARDEVDDIDTVDGVSDA